jgi:putative ABC transport system substrate-binding protein
MVLNPQAGGLVQSLQSSGNNLTGASLDIPVKLQFEALQSVVPSVKRIGVFYNPVETEKVVQPAAKVAASMGLELVTIPMSPPEQLQDLADALRSRRLDALWSVADSTVFASSRSVDFLLRRTLDARIPFMGLSPEFVKAGALLALSVDYKDIGLQCGEQAAQVLQGSAPSSVPITVPRKVMLHINLNVARAIGLRVPPPVLEKAVVHGSRPPLPPAY